MTNAGISAYRSVCFGTDFSDAILSWSDVEQHIAKGQLGEFLMGDGDKEWNTVSTSDQSDNYTEEEAVEAGFFSVEEASEGYRQERCKPDDDLVIHRVPKNRTTTMKKGSTTKRNPNVRRSFSERLYADRKAPMGVLRTDGAKLKKGGRQDRRCLVCP